MFDVALRIQSSWENFSGRGDFSRVNMGSDSIPPKLSDENINRGLVCAHMYCMDSKDPDILCLRWVNVSNKNTPNMHHS